MVLTCFSFDHCFFSPTLSKKGREWGYSTSKAISMLTESAEAPAIAFVSTKMDHSVDAGIDSQDVVDGDGRVQED
jgi:hypothetical protein